jgi:cell wall assembly regulator SMI1
MPDSLDSVWTRLEAWLSTHLLPVVERDTPGATLGHILRPGLSEEAVAAAETEFGFSFPADFRASLLRHDGAVFWPGTEDFLTLAAAWEDTRMRRELLAEQTTGPEVAVDGVRQVWWDAGWWSLNSDGGGNGLVLDARPPAGGVAGQVLDFDHETTDRPRRHASFMAYLEDVLARLDSGWYVASEWLTARNLLAPDHPEYTEDDYATWLARQPRP